LPTVFGINPDPLPQPSGCANPCRVLEKIDRAWEALLEETYNPIYGTQH
jgi:hypothetical protein